MQCKAAQNQTVLPTTQPAGGNLREGESLRDVAGPLCIRSKRIWIDSNDLLRPQRTQCQGHLAAARRKIENIGQIELPVNDDLRQQPTDRFFMRIAIVIALLTIEPLRAQRFISRADGNGWSRRGRGIQGDDT